MILTAALMPILFCREGRGEQKTKVRFLDAVMLTLKNKAFRPLVMGNFLLKFGMVCTGNFFAYLIIYNLSGGNKSEGSAKWWLFCLAINISTFVAMAFVVKLADRFGKKPMLLALLLVSAAIYSSVWFTFRSYETGFVAEAAAWLSAVLPISPAIARDWPIFLTAAGIGIFCNCLSLLMNSMLADVCGVDELASRHQHQAFYGAVFATCDKIAMGVAMATAREAAVAKRIAAEKPKEPEPADETPRNATYLDIVDIVAGGDGPPQSGTQASTRPPGG